MPRLVKRYGNRKLYDTSESRYVTLEEIARWVRAGEEVKILENDTGEDLTAVTFAQIILEEERRKSGLLSIPVLREIIQHGEAALQGIVSTVDRGMEAIRSAPERAARRAQEEVGERLGQLGRLLDETMRGSFERVAQLPALQKEMRRIERSIKALEARIARLRVGAQRTPPPPPPPPASNSSSTRSSGQG
ncbi:MAG TPA: polyhydroxyalkanoate synthesis regulator DNA-binding domain-containing protein [Candidatus Binatia bacterium]|nr:polyhydroxyalkanoate synthesis regulator DNA-binding domain-containing protein [Candidatus Binatia bacterium]